MKKLPLFLSFLLATNTWAAGWEMNLACKLIEMDYQLGYTDDDPTRYREFRFLFEGNWIKWTGKLPDKDEHEGSLKKVIRDYHLIVFFNSNKEGYIYSEELTKGQKKLISSRLSWIGEKSIEFYTKGRRNKSERATIDTKNGYIAFDQMKPYREFLGTCVSG